MRRPRWPPGRHPVDLEDRGPPPGIGHNRGPALDPGLRWRTHCWRKARAETFRTPPPEVLRRQVARAAELGLSWRAYFAIRVGSGRDVAAYLAMGVLPPGGAARLAGLRGVLLLRMGGAAEGLAWAAAAPLPPPGTPLPEGRDAVLALLRALRLPGDAVVMLGRHREERALAEAARLAKFLDMGAFFD